MAALAINGTRVSGLDVRQQNVTACLAVSNIVRSSLGPSGLDKMLVDDIGDVTITNDGATILKQLDLEHPCAKVNAFSSFIPSFLSLSQYFWFLVVLSVEALLTPFAAHVREEFVKTLKLCRCSWSLPTCKTKKSAMERRAW